MVKAYVAIITAAGTSADVVDALMDCEGVTEAHIVAGNFDVIAEMEADEVSSLLPKVTQEIQGIDGVGTTRTYIGLS
ncbi:Lrp/AsnC ligand binding domain-containing protein [Halobacteriaceae archaeon GCM10025711]